MAKNDKILLDGILDDQIANNLSSPQRDEAFEFLAFQQILKDFDLSLDEINHGSIDGRQDGGVDGFYILVNGHLLQDPEAFIWPKIGSELKVFIVSCKHHDTFKQATLDNLIASLTEILDFEIADNELKGAYSTVLLRMRSNLMFAYKRLSARLSKFSVELVYASRGDSESVGEEVAARADQLVALVKDCFGSCSATFVFMGSSELVGLHRKMPNYTLELPFVEALAKGERYVVLARLSDYFHFISDNGKLRRYLFESNVRDFMGLNRVNEDIKKTLMGEASPDFWWLNNGVTILANSASIIGKSIQATDIQIVNGLQTTESIFRHFNNGTFGTDDRCVLVKVIVSQDDVVRDAIIRATNNQTDVELASLHATDKIQRDIEDVLGRCGLYYERRKNFYANQGHAVAELVSPLYVAAGFIAFVLKMPHRSVGLRSKFMRSPAAYAEVFSETVPLGVWPVIAGLLKVTDSSLETLRPHGRATDKYLKGWRYIIAFLILSKHFAKFDFTAAELSTFDVRIATRSEVKKVWEFLKKLISEEALPSIWASPRAVSRACSAFSIEFSIAGLGAVDARSTRALGEENPKHRSTGPITDDFLERLKSVLPEQPWKPGLHRQVSHQLGCEVGQYFAGVERLIEEGLYFQQKDGVLYDEDGNVVKFDASRVDPETLMLLD